jgi:hypothetical protein
MMMGCSRNAPNNSGEPDWVLQPKYNIKSLNDSFGAALGAWDWGLFAAKHSDNLQQFWLPFRDQVGRHNARPRQLYQRHIVQNASLCRLDLEVWNAIFCSV